MKTINLLPKPRQTELRYEATLRSVLVIAALTLLSYAVVFLVQFGLKFYLQLQAGSVTAQITALQAEVKNQANADVKTKVKAANDLVTDYINLSNASPNWSRIIKAFAPLPPQGVKINSLNFIPSKKAVVINGTSPTRELVIQLYNNILQDTNDFYGIDYPLENVAQPTENVFHFTFFVKDKLWQP